MAGNRASWELHMENTLHFPIALRNGIIHGGGVDCINDLLQLDDKAVRELCKSIRRQNDTVTVIQELRLRQVRYFRFHMQRVQRPWHSPTASLQNLARLWPRFELEEKDLDEKDSKYPKKIESETAQVIKATLESIDTWLRCNRGEYGSPLAYVVRENVEPPPLTRPNWQDFLLCQG